MERTAILVLGHGSPRARANREFEALVDAFRRRRPDLRVAHAYIELASPLLAAGLAEAAAGAERVVVLPVFLFTAGHAKDDVPGALDAARRAFSDVCFEAARPEFETLLLLKAGPVLPALRAALAREGLTARAVLVCDATTGHERVLRDLDACEERPGYFSTVLVTRAPEASP